MPRKVAIAFRSGDKNWKTRDEGVGGGERGDQKREKESVGEEGEKGAAPVRDGPREDKFCNPLWSAS